eukprot:gene22093-28192_t
MIHMFNSAETVHSDGSIVSDNIKLTFSFRSTSGSVGKVIGADRNGMEEFLKRRTHLTRLRELFDINLSTFLEGSHANYMQSLTKSQLTILGPLLKLRLVNEGEMVKRSELLSPDGFTPIPMSVAVTSLKKDTGNGKNSTTPSSTTARYRQHEVDSLNAHMKSAEKCHLKYSPVALLLSGTCETIDVEPTLHNNNNNNNNDQSGMSKTPHSAKKTGVYDSIKLIVTKKSRVHHHHHGSMSAASIDDHLSDMNDMSASALGVDNATTDHTGRRNYYAPGSLMGLEHYLLKKPHLGLHNIVASELSIVGHLDLSMLAVLTAVDKRLHRVVARNFLKTVMDGVREMIPMLCDMDERSYIMLSSLVSLKSYSTGDVVYAKGCSSNHTFVVLRGTIKESMEVRSGPANAPLHPGARHLEGSAPQDNSPHINTPTRKHSLKTSSPIVLQNLDSPGTTLIQRVLGYGSLFGEVSLVTDSPYVSTTVALEPTILIAISKSVFDDIYNNNKASFAEIRIRMAGSEIGLQHVSSENLMFYYTADKFDDMCARLRKQMAAVRAANTRHVGGHESSIMIDTTGADLTVDYKGIMRDVQHNLDFAANTTLNEEEVEEEVTTDDENYNHTYTHNNHINNTTTNSNSSPPNQHNNTSALTISNVNSNSHTRVNSFNTLLSPSSTGETSLNVSAQPSPHDAKTNNNSNNRLSGNNSTNNTSAGSGLADGIASPHRIISPTSGNGGATTSVGGALRMSADNRGGSFNSLLHNNANNNNNNTGDDSENLNNDSNSVQNSIMQNAGTIFSNQSEEEDFDHNGDHARIPQANQMYAMLPGEEEEDTRSLFEELNSQKPQSVRNTGGIASAHPSNKSLAQLYESLSVGLGGGGGGGWDNMSSNVNGN